MSKREKILHDYYYIDISVLCVLCIQVFYYVILFTKVLVFFYSNTSFTAAVVMILY